MKLTSNPFLSWRNNPLRFELKSNHSSCKLFNFPSYHRPISTSIPCRKEEDLPPFERLGLHTHDHFDNPNKRPKSPLEEYLYKVIKYRGPITLSSYMKTVLTHPEFGYYINKDVFGTSGDFTTSPEISQMFGEMIGIWIVSVWENMNMPSKLNLVELGPGRGTLMSDILRVASHFKPFQSSLNLHMVDVSPTLRKIQAKTLGSEMNDQNECTLQSGLQVKWCENIQDVPSGPSIVIGHEFLDCLPVFQFKWEEGRGWCDKLVDIDSSDGPHHFKLVLSRNSVASRSLIGEIDPKSLGSDEIELCPEALVVAQDIATKIGQQGGAALFIDYGEDQYLANSLRAIKNHQFVDIFDSPGTADLSALVDFYSIKNCLVNRTDVKCLGPVTQSHLLKSLGIETRLQVLLKNANPKQKTDLLTSYHRLVNDKKMGTSYKALSIINSNLPIPVGFVNESQDL